jgi:hypothetical protein
MFRNKTSKKSGSLFIIFIAVMLIVFGMVRVSLGFIGEKDTAIITSIRRQGGERNDPVPNRYNYSIGYTFTLPDGKKVDGFTYKIGDSVYIKVSNSNGGITPIRYLRTFPRINTLESDAGIKPGNLIIIGAGVLIIKLISPRKKRVYKFKKRNSSI